MFESLRLRPADPPMPGGDFGHVDKVGRGKPKIKHEVLTFP